MNYNPMSSNDFEAISWLEEEAVNSKELGNAWKILKAYYEECKSELKNIDMSVSPFEGEVERDRLYRLADDILSNPEFLMAACILSLDSFTAPSASPTMSIAGMPRRKSTSTVTSAPSYPKGEKE